jgi:Transposase DDE domain group 1
MTEAQPRGEPCAEDGSAGQERLANRLLADPTAPELLSGGELRPTGRTRCEKSHRQRSDPESDNAAVGGIRRMSVYNRRGTAEQWIREGKNALRWTWLSCRAFRDNTVRLQLFALAYSNP